jgi:MFS family permease
MMMMCAMGSDAGKPCNSVADLTKTESDKGPGPTTADEKSPFDGVLDARPILPLAALFMGDLRDGLPMLNMQGAYLLSAQGFSEKQVGILFLCFGISQFLFLAPAGYFLDYSTHKIDWVMFSGVVTAFLTLLTAATAAPNGNNMGFMIFLKVLQGACTSIMPPGFNGITLGIVGSTGFTHQVSRNRMMHHIGTALFVAIGSLVAYFLYPNLGHLFAVAPLAAIGLVYNLTRIQPKLVDRDAARGLVVTSPTMTEYEALDEWGVKAPASTQEGPCDVLSSCSPTPQRYLPPDVLAETKLAANQTPSMDEASLGVESSLGSQDQSTLDDHQLETKDSSGGNSNDSRNFSSMPSFNIGWRNIGASGSSAMIPRLRTPLSVLLDAKLILFSTIVFFFHAANGSVLPLVMQSLALSDRQSGMLLSGLCILIAQGFMAVFAKICGDYSPIWGRKGLMLIGLFALSLRCFFLTGLVAAQEHVVNNATELDLVQLMILSTQFLDSVGMGIFGTLHILVTNDISTKTGRFSLMLGVTTAAMCLGATVSSYIGQILAQDYGYVHAFTSLGMLSLIPFLLYLLFMPETLPNYARPRRRTRKRLQILLQKLREQRRKLQNPFKRKTMGDNQKPGIFGPQKHESAPLSPSVSDLDNRSAGTKFVELV